MGLLSFSESLSRHPIDRQAVGDPVLLAEVVSHGRVHFPLVFVIACRQSSNVRVRDRLTVLNARTAVDSDPAIAVLDEHTHPRVSREVPVLHPSLRAVDDDVVAIEEVPHDCDMRRAVRIFRPDHGETLLLKEYALRDRELGPRHLAEHVARGRADVFLRGLVRVFEDEAAHDRNGAAIELSHHELGSRGDLIGHRDLGDA
jgi:hypothetical protein